MPIARKKGSSLSWSYGS